MIHTHTFDIIMYDRGPVAELSLSSYHVQANESHNRARPLIRIHYARGHNVNENAPFGGQQFPAKYDGNEKKRIKLTFNYSTYFASIIKVSLRASRTDPPDLKCTEVVVWE